MSHLFNNFVKIVHCNNNPINLSLICCNQNDDPNKKKENHIDLIKFQISNIT